MPKRKERKKSTKPNPTPAIEDSTDGTNQTVPQDSQSVIAEVHAEEEPSIDRIQNVPTNNQSQPESQPRARIGSSNQELCRFYKQNRCKHGISGKKDGICNFQHPKPCKKLLNNGTSGPRGCSKGAKCEDFHPKLCHRSLKERICTIQDCQYIHVKHTRRTEPQPQQTASNARTIATAGARSQANQVLATAEHQADHLAMKSIGQSKTSTKSQADEMKIFQESVLSQLKTMLDRMKNYDLKFEQLGAGYVAQNRGENHMQNLPIQSQSFLAQPQLYHQLHYPPVYQSYPPTIAPPGRITQSQPSL